MTSEGCCFSPDAASASAPACTPFSADSPSSSSSSRPEATTQLPPSSSSPLDKTTIRIDITSDTTCPWCFVVKRRLERAMVTFREQHRQQQLEQNQPPQEIDFDIRWYPYQLDPKAPTAATPRSKFLARKFGLDKSAHQIQDRIVQAGKVEGIQFRYDDDTLYCNTLDSHRMIELVRRRWDLEGEMVEELFQSHFERGECGDVPTLLVCARKVYLAACVQGGPLTRDASRVEQELAYLKEYLESDQGMDEVKEEIRRARQDLGLQGVPAIIVQNTYLLSGGQDPSTFVEVFKRVV